MNILYGVPGEGMGHATRTAVIVDHLIQHHELRLVASDRAFQFLNKRYPDKVVEIEGLHFGFKDGKVSKTATLEKNLRNLPKTLRTNFREFFRLDADFIPDLVISDFESFSFVYAKLHGIPFISIDNMQVMDRCKLEIPMDSAAKSDFKLARQIVKAKVPGASHYFISSFFDAEVQKKNSSLVPPIIRQSIVDAQCTRGNHILVYQSSGGKSNLEEVLNALPNEAFKVYGKAASGQSKNISYMPFSEEGFIADFASAKAVIANGGFSFISEAVYLKKPVYSFPLPGQFEQYMNAAYIEKCGFGRHFKELTTDQLKAFLYDLNVFDANLANYKQNGNQQLFQQLDTWLEDFEKGLCR